MKEEEIDVKPFLGRFVFSIKNTLKSYLKWEANNLAKMLMRIKMQ